MPASFTVSLAVFFMGVMLLLYKLLLKIFGIKTEDAMMAFTIAVVVSCVLFVATLGAIHTYIYAA